MKVSLDHSATSFQNAVTLHLTYVEYYAFCALVQLNCNGGGLFPRKQWRFYL